MLKTKEALLSTLRAFQRSLPILLGVILLVSLIQVIIPPSAFLWLFSKNTLLDSAIGSFLGSILAGNPITSYILGGELLQQGVSLMAVTAFLISWVTVGIIQLPAEIALLGKNFALVRNVTAFLLSIVIAIFTVIIYGVIV